MSELKPSEVRGTLPANWHRCDRCGTTAPTNGEAADHESRKGPGVIVTLRQLPGDAGALIITSVCCVDLAWCTAQKLRVLNGTAEVEASTNEA